MLVLALDTCFDRCAACLYDSATGAVVAEEAQIMERGHAEALAPMVARVLEGHSIGRLQRIVVTTGPGTFTGLRIGLSFARALGLAKKIPVVGLDSLHAVALSNPAALVAHQAGKSGFAYVLKSGISTNVEVLNNADLDVAAANYEAKLGTAFPSHDLPDLVLLASYASSQPVPESMPNPVYLREADAKPQNVPGAIRAAGPEDLSQLATLHAACFAKGWTEKDIDAMLSVPGTQALVAAHGDQIIGMVILRAIAGEAEILTICVAPAFRAKGIGSKLIKAALALPLEKIFLEVAHTNETARKLYAAQGFAETGLRKAYYSDGADAVLMTRVRGL